jgi:hypothetical protein
MEECPTIIPVALMKGEGKRNTSVVCNSGYFSSVPTTIKRRRTDTLLPEDILNERSIHNTGRRTWSYLEVNTKKVIVSVLEEMMFGPERKIMVNRLP